VQIIRLHPMDHRTVYFDYTKSIYNTPTSFRILSTPTDLCVFVSQSRGRMVFSDEIHEKMSAQRMGRGKKILVFCMLDGENMLRSVEEELYDVLVRNKRLS
ncbi:hypothetical protein THOM_2167, partial [Trachipleistophora hominis]